MWPGASQSGRKDVAVFRDAYPGREAQPPWCWRRLLRVPWTARRSNQSILKEIIPGCSLEGVMLKLNHLSSLQAMPGVEGPRLDTAPPRGRSRRSAESAPRARNTRALWLTPHSCATVKYAEDALGRAPADPHPRGCLERGCQRDPTFLGTRGGEVPKR